MTPATWGTLALAVSVPLAVWLRLFYEDWQLPIEQEPSIERGERIIKETLIAGIVWFIVGSVILHLATPTGL